MRRAPLTFGTAFDPRSNSFGFLRLFLAVLVIFSHSFPLGGFGIDALERFTRGRHTIGLVAVGMFFVLSGFLICRSACTAASVPRFLWHRFLRIFPGYWVCLIVCACVFASLAAIHDQVSISTVFRSSPDSAGAFIIGNAALLHVQQFSIPGIFNISPSEIGGLFGRNPVPSVINGSLWSLAYEISCYAAVAMFASFGALRRGRAIMLALFVALWGLYALYYLDPLTFREWLPYRLLSLSLMLAVYFSAGCVCFLYRDEIVCSRLLFSAAVLGLVASVATGVFGVVAPVAMTYALLWLAFRLPLTWCDSKGDFSYGTYIYAFPVQQTLSLFGLQRAGFAVYFGCALFGTAILAILSYFLVEAPCLRFKHAKIPRLRSASPVTEPVAVTP